jgi:hypothetical protein
MGAVAPLAGRAAPCHQLLQPVNGLLPLPQHTACYPSRYACRSAGVELHSVVLGWRGCGPGDEPCGQDHSAPLYLGLVDVRPVLPGCVQRLCHRLSSLRARSLYVPCFYKVALKVRMVIELTLCSHRSRPAVQQYHEPASPSHFRHRSCRYPVRSFVSRRSPRALTVRTFSSWADSQ